MPESREMSLLRAALRAVDKATVAWSNTPGETYGLLAEMRETLGSLVSEESNA